MSGGVQFVPLLQNEQKPEKLCFDVVEPAFARHKEIRGRFFNPFLIKGLKYPVRNKSH